MDEDAKARITRHIDSKKPIEQELERVFGYKPSRKQVSNIRAYTDKASHDYKNRIVLNRQTGRYYYRDKDGKFISQVRHADNVFYNPSTGNWFRQYDDGTWKRIEK